jgi:pantothenate kinase type III
MLLMVDVGNGQTYCEVYHGEELKTTFRRTSSVRASSGEFGAFLRATLRENGIDPGEIGMAGACSVAPDAMRSLELLPEILRL